MSMLSCTLNRNLLVHVLGFLLLLTNFVPFWECIWMGLHLESRIEDFWNTNSLNRSIHNQVLKHISLRRWEQIDRFFHVSKPLKPGQKEAIFDKLEPLSAHLREAFKKYWKSDTHLAVDETIQRFMGRVKEIVNIPSKPTSEGFKI